MGKQRHLERDSTDGYLQTYETRPQVVVDLTQARTAISKLAGFRDGRLSAIDGTKMKRRVVKVGEIDAKYLPGEFGAIVVRGSIRSLAKKYKMTREDAIAALHAAHATIERGSFYLMPTREPLSGE